MNKNLLLSLFITLLCFDVRAQITQISGPAGSGAFGSNITVLANGNYVVTDPKWSNGGITEVGAVYLYNGASHALISTLTGSQAYDHVGSGGISILINGNYVVKSPEWDGNTASDVGAVTWGNGTSGISGVVSISNSLVGSTSNDEVGLRGIHALNNGNYVVYNPNWDNASAIDAGAVTWGNGATGISGAVSASNSLVGSTTYDNVGNAQITVLSNGNYVVCNPAWDNGSVGNTGAVTWGNGTSGVQGVVSASNSLVGSTANDYLGSRGITVLSNDNYVVISPEWDNASKTDVGAVTWGNGTTGVKGVVSASNSLVGSTANDNVGGDGVTALVNGNYVVNSPEWDNASKTDAGAVTWGNGTTGVTGVVSVSNSLVGSTANDYIGTNGITALGNGNYVVCSSIWDNASLSNAGAVTWGNGTTGVMGVVSIANSLVGSAANDYVGGNGITTLSNGNYVARSLSWDNASVSNVGAVTWGSGTAGVTGVVSVSNSLIGSTANDNIGNNGITALSNGNYVVATSTWDNASVSNVGAVTWGNGTVGGKGVVSGSNSLVGTIANDFIGSAGTTALSNGNYVVVSSSWDNGLISNVGAVTWGDGNTGISGAVTASNSLVGSTAEDQIGGNSIIALSNGNYVVISTHWDNASVGNAGAVTWMNGTIATTGVVSISNSLVGSKVADRLGSGGVTSTSNGNYVVISPYFNNGSITDAGAITYGSGNVGLSGFLNTCNSVLGTEANQGLNQNQIFNTIYDYLLVGNSDGNFYVIHNGSPLANNNTTVTETIGSDPVIFSSDCNPIGKITPTGDANDVIGQVTMKVYVTATAPVATQPYVRRYYDISPAVDANTATGRITLFYTQADFDDFNENRESAPALPSEPADVDGKENLRITQNHGTSTTGAPGSYTGWTGDGPATVLINPEEQDILWNSVEKRWEVSFDVTGFSGFFVHSNVNEAVLPVRLVSFTARKAEENALLQWKTASEINASHFNVERSVDGRKFNMIGMVQSAGNGDGELSYSFTDTEFSSLNQIAYYRLRAVDTDGSYAFSRIERLQPVGNFLSDYIYPNPARTGSAVTIKSDGKPGDLQVLDLTGRKVEARVNQRIGNEFVIDPLPQGIYLIRFTTQTGYETRKLVVE